LLNKLIIFQIININYWNDLNSKEYQYNDINIRGGLKITSIDTD